MRVGVVVTTFERRDQAVAAVRSVLDHGPADVDVVVVDDGSTDGTPEALAALAAADGRVRVVVHDRNRGPSAAKNSGLRDLAAGVDAVAVLDSDNLVLPGGLAALAAALVAHPGHSQALGWVVDDDGRPAGAFPARSGALSIADGVCAVADGEFFRLVRRVALGNALFDERAVGGEGALWITALRWGPGLVVDADVATYDRRGTDRVSLPRWDRATAEGYLRGLLGTLDASGDDLPRHCPDRHRATLREAAKWACAAGRHREAVGLARRLLAAGAPWSAAVCALGAALPSPLVRALGRRRATRG